MARKILKDTGRIAAFSDHSERILLAYFTEGALAGATFELLESELTDAEREELALARAATSRSNTY